MDFESSRIFHIYNRGNNKQCIFFGHENYIFFLKKMSEHLKPYGNILAWCLIPNHFHFMLEVLHLSVSFKSTETGKVESRTLNDSIGIMLRSYTRAINNAQNRTGSLFQKQTKAICLNDPQFSPSYFDTAFGVLGNRELVGTNYLATCFRYIHNNPAHHNLVKNANSWEYSSYADYFCGRGGKLANVERGKELGLHLND